MVGEVRSWTLGRHPLVVSSRSLREVANPQRDHERLVRELTYFYTV